MKAPDKIYTDNRGVYAKLPIFSQIDANVEYVRKKAILKFIYDMIDQLNDRHLLDAALHCALNGIIEEIESM